MRITKEVLAGKKGAPRDIVLLNAAATLVLGRAARNLREGIAKAAEAIDSGAASRKLEELITFTRSVTS